MNLTKKEEDLCYKLAQEINDYNENKDGCFWGHILEIVEKIYKLGKRSKMKIEGIKKIEDKLRANIIRELKKNHPKGFCYICGKGKKTTIHHLREINTRKKGKIIGDIPLCRDCHDSIESMKKFKKLKQAYKQGFEDGKKFINPADLDGKEKEQ